MLDSIDPYFFLSDFDIDGTLESIEVLKIGHIHETFIGSWVSKNGTRSRYIHQKVNTAVFPNLRALQNNLDHLLKLFCDEPCVGLMRQHELTLVPVREKGESYLVDSGGAVWRTFTYLEDTRSFEVAPSDAVAAEAGRAVGVFASRLAKLPPQGFVDTIPDFLNASVRYTQLHQAIDADRVGRVEKSRELIATALHLEGKTTMIVQALANGQIPSRLSHNDTKLNNILFDLQSEKAVAVIDLDTCMQGTPLYDYADLVRNVGVLCTEDEPDLSKVHVDTARTRSVTDGFLEGVGSLLTQDERELMPHAPAVLAATLGVRFLSDYLNGDKYFKTQHPEHNAQRARTQFEIARCFRELLC